MQTDKLYRVTCRGMLDDTTGTAHGIAYVVAKDPTSAYEMLRRYLDDNDLGFERDRELDSVELVAEGSDYPDCGIRLFLADY